MTWTAGETIGRYRLERLLGSGSTSSVFVAVHTEIDRRVAMKILAPELLVEEEAVRRLLLEARVVNTIRHENIAEVYDVIEDPLALVMELIDGPSLRELATYRWPMPLAIGAMLELAEALQAAHTASVIHRDLKPDNLLLTQDPRKGPTGKLPRLKVIDFGIAKLAGQDGKTAMGHMIGTPAYMAPEQITGHPAASFATDVFAFGAVFYEVLTQQRAYPQATTPEVVRAKLRGQPPELQWPNTTPEHLRALITRCLASRPDERPPLAEIAHALRLLQSGDEHETALEAPLQQRTDDAITRPLEAIPPTVDELPILATLDMPREKAAAKKPVAPPPPPRKGWVWLIAVAAIAVIIALAR